MLRIPAPALGRKGELQKRPKGTKIKGQGKNQDPKSRVNRKINKVYPQWENQDPPGKNQDPFDKF